MRQLNNSGNFFHNAALTNVRDVVEYFNAGVPQDPTAGAAASLTPASRTLVGRDTRTVWVFPNSKSTISPTSWKTLYTTLRW